MSLDNQKEKNLLNLFKRKIGALFGSKVLFWVGAVYDITYFNWNSKKEEKIITNIQFYKMIKDISIAF